MRQVRKRKVQKKKRLSLNAMLWLTVIFIILFFTALNIKSIRGTIAKLFLEKDVKRQLQHESEPPQNTELNKPAQKQDLEENEQPSKEHVEKPIDSTQEQDPEGMQDTVSLHVYFVKIHDDGSFSLVKRMRSIKKTKAVLTKTLSMLLQGTTSEEERSGIKSFVPVSSVVKSVSVKDGVAYVNMSDDFQFNSSGQAALEAQIYQLVYTSTEFSTIDKVQILIDGKKVSYLSGEGGLFLAEPLSRHDLSSKIYRE